MKRVHDLISDDEHDGEDDDIEFTGPLNPNNNNNNNNNLTRLGAREALALWRQVCAAGGARDKRIRLGAAQGADNVIVLDSDEDTKAKNREEDPDHGDRDLGEGMHIISKVWTNHNTDIDDLVDVTFSAKDEVWYVLFVSSMFLTHTL